MLSVKKFSIIKGTRVSVSWSKLREELDKCVLLCANCHAGVHAGHIEVG